MGRLTLAAAALVASSCAASVPPADAPSSDATDTRARERCDRCDDDAQCAAWPGTRCIRGDTDGVRACYDPNRPANTCL